MVEEQIASRGVIDRSVLDSMRKVPREKFVAPGYEDVAYDDLSLPIGMGQTISPKWNTKLVDIATADAMPLIALALSPMALLRSLQTAVSKFDGLILLDAQPVKTNTAMRIAF